MEVVLSSQFNFSQIYFVPGSKGLFHIFGPYLVLLDLEVLGVGGVGDRRSLEGVEKVLVKLRANLLVLLNFGAPTKFLLA